MGNQIFQALSTVGYVVSGVAVAGNLLVLLVFATTKQLRVKYYGFVLSLVIADTVFATVFIVLNIKYSALTSSIYKTSFFVAQLSVLAVAVNRLMALSILPPARYDAIVTGRRITLVCVLLWVVSAVLFFPSTYLITKAPVVVQFIRPLATLLILVITAVVYYAVFRKISGYRPPLASTPGITEDDEQTKTRMHQTRNLMITFTIILATSFLCWIPYCVANVMVFFSSSQRLYYQSRNFKIFYMVTILNQAVNSAVNPFIYWWRISEVRDGFLRLLRVCFRQQTARTEVQATYTEIAVESAM